MNGAAAWSASSRCGVNKVNKSGDFVDLVDLSDFWCIFFSCYKAEAGRREGNTSLLLETADTVTPFSFGMLLELLLGELGPEPGALLHAESGREDTVKNRRCWSMCVSVCASLTCHVQGALLGGGDGTVSPSQQRAAPPLAHLLLQPRAQFQVGLRGCRGGKRKQ